MTPAWSHGPGQHERLLIVDFGSQVTQLIARRLREIGVYCQIHPCTAIDAALVSSFAPRAIILSGGPAYVGSGDQYRLDPSLLTAGVPVLGICYGQQVMMQALGGSVISADTGEFGCADLAATAHCSGSRLLRGWFADGAQTEQVWMSHGDTVSVLAPGFVAVATSSGAPYAVVEDRDRAFYGVQFHPEVTHTPLGERLLRNFALDIAHMRGDWTMASYAVDAVSAVRSQVGERRVICGLSGGVDSAVTALVVHRAIGSALTCVFVDTGLLRSGEAEAVIAAFSRHFAIELVHIDASEEFFAALSGVTDPESKRKRIGATFIEVFERAAGDGGGADFLAQGTLYPDVIESFTSGPAATIKSHHNVGGLPERMNMALVEPLRDLFKDEVRALGRELGLPGSMTGRHPFPGPGLAIRIPGEVTPERVELLRRADAIYLDEIVSCGLYEVIWQAFAVLLPVQSVGVMGDSRAYDSVLALRAVTSTDGMTADYYPFDHGFLGRVARRIVNEVPGIGRVVYDITSKPPGTIEWE